MAKVPVPLWPVEVSEEARRRCLADPSAVAVPKNFLQPMVEDEAVKQWPGRLRQN